jgi:ankyrin repeat protein
MTEKLSAGQQLYAAMTAGNVEDVQAILQAHPEELNDSPGSAPTWLHHAARLGSSSLIDMLLAAGLDVDHRSNASGDAPLNYAVRAGQLDAAKHLISRGAVPGVSRMLIGAINSEANSFGLVKLLVEHGADVNESWRFGDEESGPVFNALSWAIDSGRSDIAEYLRSRGAVLPAQSPAKRT